MHDHSKVAKSVPIDCKSENLSVNSNKIAGLQRELKDMKQTQDKTKLFMYMVIHDLKHPTESLVNALETHLKEFEDLKT